MGLLDRLAPRRSDAELPHVPGVSSDGPLFPTKALPKFLSSLTSCETPILLDLGPVVGSNVSFFGEQLGCKILVHDLFADLDRFVREARVPDFPEFLKRRFSEGNGTIDGVLCWDIFDYIDRPAGEALAGQLVRVLRAGGALLGFFGGSQLGSASYTKYIIASDRSLKYRPYSAARGRQRTLPNRDILRLFDGLRVADSFLLKNNIREILFRKPA
jgi:hypothetical protein